MKHPFVLDCSVTLAWCFKDEESAYADRVLNYLDQKYIAWVPQIWTLEIGNILAIAERRKRITESGMMVFLERLKKLPIHVDQLSYSFSLSTTLTLARTHGLSTYDAAYLGLCMREGYPLATLDKQLIAAAQEAGVLLVD